MSDLIYQAMEAGALIYKSLRAWSQWEADDRKMDTALWELFKIKLEEKK